ncbi:YhbY family RNA-binding protein [Oenococcus alcoholitolerans]
MEILTGKQKRYLRAQGNKLPSIFTVGKNGLSKIWLQEVIAALDQRELVKVGLQQSSEVTADQLIDFIHKNSRITVIQKLGRTLLLYLPSKKEENRRLSMEVGKLAN